MAKLENTEKIDFCDVQPNSCSSKVEDMERLRKITKIKEIL